MNISALGQNEHSNMSREVSSNEAMFTVLRAVHMAFGLILTATSAMDLHWNYSRDEETEALGGWVICLSSMATVWQSQALTPKPLH